MASSTIKRDNTGEGLIFNNMTELMSKVGASDRLYVPITAGTASALSNVLTGTTATGLGIFKQMDARIDYAVFLPGSGVITLGNIDKSTQAVTINQTFAPSPVITASNLGGNATSVFHINGMFGVLFYKRGARFGIILADAYSNGSPEFIGMAGTGITATLEEETTGDEYKRKLSVSNSFGTVVATIGIGLTRVS